MHGLQPFLWAIWSMELRKDSPVLRDFLRLIFKERRIVTFIGSLHGPSAAFGIGRGLTATLCFQELRLDLSFPHGARAFKRTQTLVHVSSITLEFELLSLSALQTV
jgi:hypothetical protein